MSVLDCFQLFMGKDMIAALWLWTNTRAAYFFPDNPNVSRKTFMGKKWSDVTEEEMYIFISLQLLMGVTHLPKISDYWSTSVLCQGPPIFGAVVSRNRFRFLDL